MQWSSRPKFHISRSKIISSKDTDGKEKFHRMLSFLLVDEKGFFTKLFFEEFKVFFTRRSARPILKRNQAAKFWKNFQVLFVHCTQENYVLKRKLMYLQVNTLHFLDILSILRSASVPDLRFVLDFAIYS